jgi:ferredoxin
VRAAVALRVRVDPIACDGFGHCAELAPELVGLDEWGYPILLAADRDHGPGEVPAHLARVARVAAEQCPRRALLVERAAR